MTRPSEDLRLFPILWTYRREDGKEWERLGCPRTVPWAFMAPHAERAMKNHDQTLERLAERGGLSPSEMVCVLENRGWRDVLSLSDVDAIGRLLAHCATWNEEEAKRLDRERTAGLEKPG
jgi:hypothetical protein